MQQFLKKHWFLLSLVLCITTGLTVGTQYDLPLNTPAAEWTGADRVVMWLRAVQSRILVAFVLLLMAFSLNSRQLRDAFRAPAPVIWASSVNYGLIPLMGFGLAFLQPSRDYAYGLTIAACVPCTLAAVSVWTRKAGGNDAVSLLVTLITNSACFIVTPFWLHAFTRNSEVHLDPGQMVTRLIVAVLVPTIVGQLLRVNSRCAAFATGHKTAIGAVAQCCILAIVLVGSLRAGLKISVESTGPGWIATITVWSSCIAIHLSAMFIGLTGARLFGFSRPDRIAVAFASSQKTLPIGILIASDYFGEIAPFAVFPMLMYHASQLFLDTPIADRFALAAEAEEARATDT